MTFTPGLHKLFGNSAGFIGPARIRSAAAIPSGSWPLEMRSEMAAAYCDEPSVPAFLAKVERNVYSAPIREKGLLTQMASLET
jgi:hypothetical protein